MTAEIVRIGVKSNSLTPLVLRSGWVLTIATVALLLLALQSLGFSAASSATFDEPYHVGAGYAHLRTGDARLNSDHPPLIDAWVALPLLLLDLDLPLESMAWQRAEYGSFGDVFLWQANPSVARQIVRLARMPNLALAVLLGAAIFRWTGELAGRAAGLLALTLYVLDPGIVAHASLATNDLGAAAMLFLATYAWWRWLERPTVTKLVPAGLLAGAACASKYSGLAIGPIIVCLAVVHRHAGGRTLSVWLQRAAGIVGAGLICLVTIWAIYGFALEGGIPAPAFWRGLGFQGGRLVSGQPTYALGRVWPAGIWFYYPLALALKTPLGAGVLSVAGLAAAVKQRARPVLLAFGLPAALFGAAVWASALQLGHRFLLPLLPFMLGIGGCAVFWLSRPFRRGARLAVLGGIGLLIAWLVVDAARIYPHHLSFFNQLAGGAEGADRYLVDANLDWGQDLPALGKVMAESGISSVHLGYFGSAVPDLYGVHYWPAPGFLRFVDTPEALAFNPYTPDPGWYAISRTSLRQGLVLTHPDLYASFRARAPEARAGFSINLYRVDYPSDVTVRRALVQGRRVADVPAERLGWREGERLVVKWVPDQQAFIFAMGGSARYLVDDPLSYAPDLRAAMLGAARTPAAGILEVDARAVIEPILAQWSAESPMWTPPGGALDIPADFDQMVRLIGYRLADDRVSREGSVSLVLLWQVRGELRPPIASFVHLIDLDGVPRAQYDGWGAALRGLEPGDVIAHQVTIPIAADVTPGVYRLQVGLYSPDTMRRWQVAMADGPLDRIWLPQVEVE